MHGQDPSMLRGRPYGSSGGFDFGNIVGDPFALATVSISIIAWLIAFVSQALADSNPRIKDYPKFAWWTITFELFCILLVAIVVAKDQVYKYHVAIVGFLAAGVVLTCSAANTFVYSLEATMEAAGAGHILLSIIQCIWIFYFGSTADSLGNSYHDSFAMQKDKSGYGLDRPHTSTSSHQAPQMYTSAQLNGFETSSPTPTPGPSATPQPGAQAMVEPEVAAPTEYPYRAKAIYSYDANPEDVNEISFAKHEILEVSDVSGRWWQARKQNGETGIAPSNYLILL
ncbi:hypothetical protein FPQ18DRAFT_366494 [Pyronema domesticum]|nr:hypothetical protein FPQ18DRAFT_366494 [Pyronema domesticum]